MFNNEIDKLQKISHADFLLGFCFCFLIMVTAHYLDNATMLAFAYVPAYFVYMFAHNAGVNRQTTPILHYATITTIILFIVASFIIAMLKTN